MRPSSRLIVACLWMQGIFFDRFRFSADGVSAVSCDFDVSIRRGKLMSYSTILSQWYVSAHCYNLYYCLKSALITPLEDAVICCPDHCFKTKALSPSSIWSTGWQCLTAEFFPVHAQILSLTLIHQLDRERSKGPSRGIALLRLIFNTIIS